MKTAIGLIAALLPFTCLHATEFYSAACDTPAVAYTTPVVYQAPVVYNAPVSYHAPVFYMAAAANAVVMSTPVGYCSSPSTVIHITGGRGTYVTSNCGYSGSSVVVIGSRYARQDHQPRFSTFRHRWYR